jgi:hypothetical protein
MLKRRMMSIASAVALMGAVLPSSASAQCEPAWSGVGGGVSGGSQYVLALTVFDDGSGDGPAIYAVGSFDAAGGVAADGIARWGGVAWSPLGSGLGPNAVRSLGVFDDGSGSGPALYAGGWFQMAGGTEVIRIAKWNGAAWAPLGDGIDGGGSPNVATMAVFDDGSGAGPALYVGGAFDTAGGVVVNGIAKWDGSTWSALGSGMSNAVRSLAVFDDGSGAGPALYAGGLFNTAGGVTVNRIAKWDGSTWSALNGGISGTALVVYALTVFDDGLGAGPALYAGGLFERAGGVTANHIAKWDGAVWSGLGGGMGPVNPWVGALTGFDDGTGSALYAGGNFTTAGGVAVSRVAKWDGVAWSALGAGVNESLDALAIFDDRAGGGPALYASGHFSTAGGQVANYVARWGCEAAACYADCDGSAALDFFDFLCFQNLFSAADPGADCDASAELDFFDFLCFQNAFAAGCP